MTRLTIELRDEDAAFLADRVAHGEATSPAVFVADLVRTQRIMFEEVMGMPDHPDDSDQEEEADPTWAADFRARTERAKARDPVAFQQAVERMQQMIREGIESGPAVEMTDADWDRIRKNVRDRLARLG